VFVVDPTVPDHSRISPRNAELEMGDKAIFCCDSNGDTTWFFERKVLPKKCYIKEDETGNFLTIREHHYGQFQCYGCLRKDCQKHFIAEGYLKVYGGGH